MSSSKRTGSVKTKRNINIMAVILLVVFVAPAVVFGLYVAPWFFLIMLGAAVIPLLYLIKTDD
jgi:hypothetical protein